MTGEKDLDKVLKTLKPKLNPGDYVFCTIQDLSEVNLSEVVSIFKEHEGITIVIEKQIADRLKLDYSFIASWITLTVHSSLQAVGLTATFSKALSDSGIGCNVISAYYHDHIFTAKNDAKKAIDILNKLSE